MLMKNTFKQVHACFLLLALSFFTLAAACGSDDEAVEPQLTLPEQIVEGGMSFTKEGGSQTLSVKSNVQPEVTSNAPDWCSVTPETSQSKTVYKYSITAAANSVAADRSTTITVKAGTLSASFNVTQIAADGLLLESDGTLAVGAGGGTVEVKLSTNGKVEVEIEEIAATWIKEAPATRDAMASLTKRFTVSPNYSTARQGTITFRLGTLAETVTVEQAEGSQPGEGMESNAAELAAKIKIGWNLGNSLEAPEGETAWGNPKTTKTLIDAVKAAGFNAVRIPCAWDSYLEDQTSYKIKESWLARVAEVVDYCLANDMYAIINTHWDGGWLENNPTYAKQEEVNKKLEAIWTQIAGYFAAYDEHLLFAGTNEVHVENVYTDPTEENNTVQQSFNQTFVSAVRATGGNNLLRNLIVQTYNTNIDWGVRFLNLPEDVTENRLMVEVHYYDPYNFVLDDNAASGIKLWGEPYKQYGETDSWGQEDYLDATFAKAKEAFIDKGYPVILGEYGAIRRSSLTGDELQHHLDSRAYYLKSVTAAAKKYGIVPFYWDNGYEGDNTMAIFRRSTGAVYDQQALDALMEGANQ